VLLSGSPDRRRPSDPPAPPSPPLGGDGVLGVHDKRVRRSHAAQERRPAGLILPSPFDAAVMLRW
jgi:hypothetical protein